MNTYNQNLSTTVNNSLTALELEQKKTQSEFVSSELTLYHAEGARITAQDKLNKIEEDYDFYQAVDAQGVDSDNLSANLLSSSKQAAGNVANAIANAASAGANVEIAATAVTKLASDVGAILNIVAAADYGTDIYKHAENANDLISVSAYNAELASQHAMESTKLTSEISASTVQEKATLAKSKVEKLLGATTSQFKAVASDRTATYDRLAKASKAEQVSQGELEDIMVLNNAVGDAYTQSNDNLNLNLTVTNVLDYGFDVSFDILKTPFKADDFLNVDNDKPFLKSPVDSYNLMFVKNQSKALFSLSNAEGCLDYSDRFVPITAESLGRKQSVSQTVVASEWKDAHGDPLKVGEEYVVFLFIEYKKSYKKLVSNFDDFLSVPSLKFTMAFNLPNASSVTHAITNKKDVVTITLDEVSQEEAAFSCILIQDDIKLTSGLLTSKGIEVIAKEVKGMSEDSDRLDPKIQAARDTVAELKSKLSELSGPVTDLEDVKEQISDLQKQIKEAKGPTKISLEKKMAELVAEREALHKEIKQNEGELKKVQAELTLAENQLSKYEKELEADEATRAKAMSSAEAGAKSTRKLGVYFNMDVAKTVSPANMLTVQNDTKSTSFSFKIEDNTTDNFGNVLIEGARYIPVILTSSTAPETDQSKYIGCLSNYENTVFSFVLGQS